MVIKIRKNILYIISIAIITAVLIGIAIFYYSKSPVARCRDIECVKKYARAQNFNVEDCAKVADEFKDVCYHTYGIENPLAKQTGIGKSCILIEDPRLRAECYYKVGGADIVLPGKITENLNRAISSLNPENCANFKNVGRKEQCLKDIEMVSKAISQKDVSLCLDKNTGISYYAMKLCFSKVKNIKLPGVYE